MNPSLSPRLVAIHRFELDLLDPCIAMSQRGIRIDEARRRELYEELKGTIEPIRGQLQVIIPPLLSQQKPSDVPKLFRETWVCPCCRGGSKKSQACWSCAGYDKAPTAKTKKAALVPCTVCNGEARRESLTFNPQSEQQIKFVLYELLKLPKRMKYGKLRSDEDAMKGLLAHDTSGVVQLLLDLAKSNTMLRILERVRPGSDGRLRTFYNPAGTETGRFSSAESFLVRSTNLQNMPKKEASRDSKFDVRSCFVADDKHVLIEADLAGAEAWVTAALCADTDLLAKLRTPGFDVHKWTASHIYQKPVEQINKTERFLGKVARHALNYGMQWKTFMDNVNSDADRTGVSITAAEAKRICAAYHGLHPKLEMWWRLVGRQLDQTGKLTTVFGRTRTFYGRRSAERWLDPTHREAIAFGPQSTVADLLNRGLLRWWNQHDGRLGTLLLQIHDAVLIQTTRPGAASVALRRCLEEEVTINGITLTIPATVESGPNWANLSGT